MKMLEKKQVVQEWSLQHQKNEVFDGIMEVWNKGMFECVLVMFRVLGYVFSYGILMSHTNVEKHVDRE